MAQAPVATLLVVGNEILSGKVADTNGAWLLYRLRQLGVRVRRLHVLPDDVGVIAEHVARAEATSDWVLTSGGVGPTHDDVTIAGVARGQGRAVVQSPTLAESIYRHFGAAPGAALRMALVPEGSELVRTDRTRMPVLRSGKVWILPGVPGLLRRKFETIAPLLGGVPVCAAAVYLDVEESTLAPPLDATVAAHPRVDFGSYPRMDTPGYRVMVTLEAEDRGTVDQALADLLERIDRRWVLSIDAAFDPCRTQGPPEP